jgi:hypothetical protein
VSTTAPAVPTTPTARSAPALGGATNATERAFLQARRAALPPDPPRRRPGPAADGDN